MAATAVAGLAVLTVMAGSNALYKQPERHPAPLFFPRPVAHLAVATVSAHPRPAPANPVDADTTGSVTSRPAATAATHQVAKGDLAAVQQKLAAFHLFEGPIDGYYGPRTASAIRAFEQRAGMKPHGRLTPEIIDAILKAAAPQPTATAVSPTPVAVAAQVAPVPLPPLSKPLRDAAASVAQPRASIMQVASVTPMATIAPQSVVAPPATNPSPVAIALAPATPTPLPLPPARPLPQPAPTPVAQQVAPPTTPATSAVQVVPMSSAPRASAPSGSGRALPSSDQVLDAAASTAAGAFDAVVSMVGDVTGTSSPSAASSAPSRPVKVASINPSQPAPIAPATPAVTAPATIATPPAPADQASQISSTDITLVTKVQRGLASLGFLGTKIDGVAGEATAKAIRNFEVYYNYQVTGQVTPGLLDLLVQAGAVT